jgi:methyl-accepting chemotaxis protein
MPLLGLLHHHPRHQARQLRWVVPTVGLLALATLAALAIQYHVSDQDVTAEFFRAHKAITHTGQLLERGILISAAVLLLLLVGVGLWALRTSHRIVRPVHTLHRALEELAEGDLGVRVELHQGDEFHEVGDALNHLVDEFSTTLTTLHLLVDRIAGLVGDGSRPAASVAAEVQALVAELDRAMDFFRVGSRRTLREDDRG